MRFSIREERVADQAAISDVNQAAFANDAEPRLINALRDNGYVRLSLVAENASGVVGHILFSELVIQTPQGPITALSLAPMAVLPEFQRQGIGSKLVKRGLELCRERGYHIVVVVGHRQFYPRFGFSVELAKQLDSPYSGDSCMVAELAPGAMNGVTGRVVYPPPFQEL